MTFRWHSVGWALLVWAEIFAYTLLTLSDSTQLRRTVPIAALLCTIVAFIAFVFHKSKELKAVVLFACWGLVANIAIFLRIWSVVDDAFLNIYITVTSILTSIVWCIISHSSQVSEAAWHWYIWFTIVLTAVCGAFNNQLSLAKQIYILNTAILLVIQLIYAWYTFKNQAAGRKRCKHLWRIAAGTTVACTLLVGSILQKSSTISDAQWESCVVSVEIAAALFIITDAVIGFNHDSQETDANLPIKYEQLGTNDNTP